jgi:dihydroflavonol-4-reductase
MKKIYLITGATGHLGSTLVQTLLEKGEHIRALVLPGEEALLPEGVDFVIGNVLDRDCLSEFFRTDGFDKVTLIHCAAMITIASKRDPQVWNVNVRGTKNVMSAAWKSHVDRVIYVSSAHAIPEKKKGTPITEVSRFLPHEVIGQYARSKAAAAEIVLKYARNGLNASVVHPSGIIGPGDKHQRNHMVRTVFSMAKGSIPVGISGGYDFVDSRDVAEGILKCESEGKRGECYLLSGSYITIRDLLDLIRNEMGKGPARFSVPYPLVRLVSPAIEFFSHLVGQKKPLLTPYSVYTLHSNGTFSHKKATEAWGYQPRDIKESVRDTLQESDFQKKAGSSEEN